MELEKDCGNNPYDCNLPDRKAELEAQLAELKEDNTTLRMQLTEENQNGLTIAICLRELAIAYDELRMDYPRNEPSAREIIAKARESE